MIMKLTMYEKVYAYGTSWIQVALEEYPFTAGLLTALFIDQLLFW
jgi:hypothetical protein